MFGIEVIVFYFFLPRAPAVTGLCRLSFSIDILVASFCALVSLEPLLSRVLFAICLVYLTSLFRPEKEREVILVSCCLLSKDIVLFIAGSRV